MRFLSIIIHSSPECKSPAQFMQEVTEFILLGILVAYQVTPVNYISISCTKVFRPKTTSKALSTLCLYVISTINPRLSKPPGMALIWL